MARVIKAAFKFRPAYLLILLGAVFLALYRSNSQILERPKPVRLIYAVDEQQPIENVEPDTDKSGAKLTAVSPSRAETVAIEDAENIARISGSNRLFSQGTRPVIRWVKGDGLDDYVTRTAIGQATQLFGDKVDYCLVTLPGVSADRVREILEWAHQPVEWWPVDESANPVLAAELLKAECPPERFGFWWKWFPERVRPDAPEIILDGDQVIITKPAWFDKFLTGTDVLRVSQENSGVVRIMYGQYHKLIDVKLHLYSGLIALPPGLRFMHLMLDVLKKDPLKVPHNGKKDMDEQGVVVAAFQTFKPLEFIPLYEFPHAFAHTAKIEYGVEGDQGKAWGYHFSRSFIMRNAHFIRLMEEGVLYNRTTPPSHFEATLWLGNHGQWGMPGWSMNGWMTNLILRKIEELGGCKGKTVVELGTSRGRMSAALARAGCVPFTTVDQFDRGAAKNLELLPIKVVQAESTSFLTQLEESIIDMLIVDMHGNGPERWKVLGSAVERALAKGGKALINNAVLYKLSPWEEETGVRDWLGTLDLAKWNYTVFDSEIPGLAVVEKL